MCPLIEYSFDFQMTKAGIVNNFCSFFETIVPSIEYVMGARQQGSDVCRVVGTQI